jgi:hypothetical protein
MSNKRKHTDAALECTICMDVYKNPCVVACGHTFCEECVDGKNFKECPMCRARTVHGGTYYPVYALKSICDDRTGMSKPYKTTTTASDADGIPGESALAKKSRLAREANLNRFFDKQMIEINKLAGRGAACAKFRLTDEDFVNKVALTAKLAAEGIKVSARDAYSGSNWDVSW